MRHILCNLLISLTILGLTGCASQGLKPQTGDISFRLHWQGDYDLDLHVKDPNGVSTGVPNPTTQSPQEMLDAFKQQLEAESGADISRRGILDVDCNASPMALCDEPIENIYWPKGSAPTGVYEAWVYLFQPLRDEESQVPYVLEVRRGKRVVETFEGVVANAARNSERIRYAYAGAGGA